MRAGPELAAVQPGRGQRDPAGQGGVDEHLAVADAAQVVDELAAPDPLQQEAGRADPQRLVEVLLVVAAGFLLKRIRGGELVEYLRRIGDGEVLIDPALAGRVALSAARLHSGEFWPGAHLGLTQRESEVLSLLVAGLSNRAIAAKLVVSEETVKTHARGIYRKLGVSDRAAAVTVALREGVFH